MGLTMTFMVGLIVFMDNCSQFGFPLLERDAFRQFVFANCAKRTIRRGNLLSSRLVNLLFVNVFCRILFCHFSILFSGAKIYNYLNCSILFLVKKSIVVCLRHTASHPRRTPHTKRTEWVPCGVTEMACILHAAEGFDAHSLIHNDFGLWGEKRGGLTDYQQ